MFQHNGPKSIMIYIFCRVNQEVASVRCQIMLCLVEFTGGVTWGMIYLFVFWEVLYAEMVGWPRLRTLWFLFMLLKYF